MILNEEEKFKSLIARVTHDILSPIHTIQGIAQLTKEESDTSRKNEYANMLLRTTVDLTNRVEELISEYFEADQSYQTIDLTKIAHRIIDQLKPPDDIVIKIFNNCTRPFKSHENKLFSLLQNLIDNSIKYQDVEKTKGFVQVQFDQVEDGIVITVSDNGPGIPAELQQKIFHEGVRVNHIVNGHGLGLFIVKSIVVELHGKIDIESSSKGSIFYIKLPNADV
ncbi:MAG: sensor histidine kinase [Candidatus Cyclobacteriaceae bacterium M3_2C_046]